MNKLSLLSICFTLSIHSLCQAQTSSQKTELSLGAMQSFSQSPYRLKEQPRSFLPNIHYDSPLFYMDGTEFGLHALHDSSERTTVNIEIQYLDQNYNRHKTHHYSAMRALKNRHSTFMGGIGLEYLTDFGNVYLDLLHDLADHSNGSVATLGFESLLQWGNYKFIPEVGINWANQKQNNYYYGISRSESNASGYDKYRSSSSLSPFTQITLAYDLTPKWTTYIQGRYDKLSHEIHHSPMVNRQHLFGINLGLNYNY